MEEVGCTVESAFELNKKKTSIKTKLKDNKIILNKRIFDKLINQLVLKIDAIKSNIHSELIDQLINYVNEYKNELKSNLNRSSIHTGIISISCSETEYEFIFEELIKKLNDNEFNEIIYLDSSDNNLNLDKIKEMIKDKILNDDLLNELGIKTTHYRKFKQNLSSKEFAKIYNQHFINQPLIIIINDLISMNCDTIDDLFRFLDSNLKLNKLPIMVLCGLSQACVSLQSLIKPHNLNKLLLHSFASKNSFDIFDNLFNSIFIGSKLDLRFGSKILDHFYNTFIYYNNSINKIEYLAKLSIFYFSKNDYSYLNGDCGEEFNKKLDKMSSNDLKKLRDQLKSIDEKFSENDEEFKLELKKEFININKIELEFLNELKSLYQLIKTEDKSAVNSFFNLYVKFLSKNGIKDELNEINKILLGLSAEEWKFKLMNIINNDELNKSKLSDLLKQQLNELDKPINNEQIIDDQKIIYEKKIKFDKKNLKLHELSLVMKKKIKEAKSKSNSFTFDNWRGTTINLIKKHLCDLVNPANTFLNELFYFDNIDKLKQFNLVSSREAILNDLKELDKFKETIKCKNYKELNNFNLDICNVFQTYRESDYKINLYDWLECSLAVLEQNELYNKDNKFKSPRKKKKLTIDKNQLANRFINNVHSLEHIGIFESDSRSKDRIVKIIH